MSYEAWWLALKTNQKLVLNILVGVSLFAAGWQLGRVMSPYYAAHPIVFQEGLTDAGGSQEELVQLREVGNMLSTDHGNTSASVTPVNSPGDVAGVATPGRFVGSANSNKYHAVPECSSWKQIKDTNRVWFASKEAAEAAGYEPTSCTAGLLN